MSDTVKTLAVCAGGAAIGFIASGGNPVGAVGGCLVLMATGCGGEETEESADDVQNQCLDDPLESNDTILASDNVELHYVPDSGDSNLIQGSQQEADFYLIQAEACLAADKNLFPFLNVPFPLPYRLSNDSNWDGGRGGPCGIKTGSSYADGDAWTSNVCQNDVIAHEIGQHLHI